MSAFASIKIGEASFRRAEVFLTKLPLELRTNTLGRALRAAAMPVVKMAKSLAPQSIMTGSFELWSKTLKAARAGVKPHSETVATSSTRSYPSGVVAIYVGPTWPAGNLINVIGNAHQQVVWGHRTGKIIPANKYLDHAAQLTQSDQGQAFRSKVELEIKKVVAQEASASQ